MRNHCTAVKFNTQPNSKNERLLFEKSVVRWQKAGLC